MTGTIQKVVGNFLNLNIINMLGIAVPVLAMPKLSGALGQDGYAVVLLASFLHQVGVLVLDYSFNLGGARDIAKLSDWTERRSYYLSVQATRFALLGVYSGAAMLYLMFSDVGISPWEYLVYIATGLLGHVWFASWYHLGTSTLSQISVLMLASRFAYLIAVLALVGGHEDVHIALAANSLPMLVLGMLACARRYQRLSIRPTWVAPQLQTIISGLPLFIADFAPNLYNNLPALYLAHAADRGEFAMYAVAMRLINAATAVQLMLGRAMLPMMSLKREITVGPVLLTNLLLASVMWVGFWLFSDVLVEMLVGVEYQMTTNYLLFLAPSLLFVAVISGLGIGFYVPRGLDLQLRDISVVFSLIAFCGGVPLVLGYGVWGGVLLLFMARALVAAGLLGHFYVAARHVAVGVAK